MQTFENVQLTLKFGTMATKNDGSRQKKSVYSNKDFVYAYGWNRLMMHSIGGWPEDDDNFFMKNRAYLNGLGLFLFVVLPQSASYPVFWGNLNAVIECLGVSLAVNISLLKLVWFRMQRPTVHRLLKQMATDWLQEKTKEEHENMMKLAEIIRLFSSFSFYGTLCLFVAFSSSQILLGLQLKDDPDVDPRLSIGFLYTCVFPFDTSSVSVFIPIWIIQFMMTYVSMAGYSSPDIFLAMFIVHQCGQLQVLRNRLEKIVNERTVNNSQQFWKKLGEIVDRHEHLNKRAAEIEEHFNQIFLADILTCVFTFCSQGFSLITILGEIGGISPVQVIFFIVFSTYDMAHLFIYCWAGDLLITESSKIGVSLYNSEWYNLASYESKSVLMINSRCTRPQQVTGGKFTIVSLQLFASVIKTSLSYLSVLLAVKV